MLRLFIAIEVSLNPKLNNVIAILKKELASSEIGWVKKNNLHLTLFFLGDTQDYYTKSIGFAIAQVVKRFSKFKILLKDVKTFNRRGIPKILYLDIVNPDQLIHIHSELKPYLEQLGLLHKNELSYNPHLTLGRIKHGQDIIKRIKALKNTLSPLELEAKKIILYKSELNPSGVIYKSLIEEELK